MKSNRSLYQRLLGEEYLKLAYPIQALHSLTESRKYRGICQVIRGTNIFARILANIMALPKAGSDLPLTVEFRASKHSELWIRHFDGKSFYSEQSQVGTLLHEKVSFIILAFYLQVIGDTLNLELKEIYFFRVPILKLCRFQVKANEWEEEGKFHLRVMVKAPFIGRIIEYRGWLIADA